MRRCNYNPVLAAAGFVVFSLLGSQSARGVVTWTFEEDAGDVVLTTTGSFDLTGLNVAWNGTMMNSFVVVDGSGYRHPISAMYAGAAGPYDALYGGYGIRFAGWTDRRPDLSFVVLAPSPFTFGFADEFLFVPAGSSLTSVITPEMVIRFPGESFKSLGLDSLSETPVTVYYGPSDSIQVRAIPEAKALTYGFVVGLASLLYRKR